MVRVRNFMAYGVFVVVFALSLCSPSFADSTLSLAKKATLQAAMQTHIERQLVDGAYQQLNLDTGDVRRLHPSTAHPMIVSMGEVYVLCTDFRDDSGKPVNVDFYLTAKGNSFVVVQTIVGNRERLERLMKIGKAVLVS